MQRNQRVLASLPMSTRTIAAAVAAGGLLATVAPLAMAVNVSSSDGNGSESVTTWYSNGARFQGQLRSNTGRPVYFQARILFSVVGDTGWKRLTGDTTSRSYVSRNDTLTYLDSAQSPRGADVRVCRNISAAPDSCGSSGRINR